MSGPTDEAYANGRRAGESWASVRLVKLEREVEAFKQEWEEWRESFEGIVDMRDRSQEEAEDLARSACIRAVETGAYLLKLESEAERLRKSWEWARERLEARETVWKGEYDRLKGQHDRLQAENKRLRAEVQNFKTRDNRETTTVRESPLGDP